MRRAALCAATALALPAHALDGDIAMHDPSTVIASDGRYYVYGTGKGLPFLVSDDGWTWRRSGSLMAALPDAKPGPEVLARGGNNTWAPDVIRVGKNFYVYYAAPGTQPRAAIGLLVGRTLDPASPEYHWEDGGAVAWSDGVEDANAIDPGVLLDPADGRLWLTYGSYFGYIRLVELDPRTGKRRDTRRAPVNLAINSEASVLISHDGWYYLLVTHGSCCAGASSTYNIRMGRSRKVTGPYLDHTGIDMLEGGGKLFAGSRGRHIGPGHFGLLDLGDGVQKFSTHYEADLDHGGISVLDIRPLLWRDGWPFAGDNIVEGTYALESARTGTVLELAVQGSDQVPADVAAKWGASTAVRLAPAMLQAQQKWAIAPVSGAGGYPGAPYFRITIAQTDRSLTAIAGGELTVAPFIGAAEQLWRIDQLTDGSYRISPKAIPGTTESLSLSAVGSSMPTLSRFDVSSDRQRWNLGTP